jgi:hypothetical protein
MTSLDALTSAWKELPLQEAPHVLPEDLAALKKAAADYVTFDLRQYLERGERRNDQRLHLGLLPQPWFGDLAKADIFILMLNPGLHPLDYFAEDQDPVFRAALINNLHQTPGRAFPFPFLDPQFWWHPGSDYFRRRLGWIAERLASRNGHPHGDALAEVARRVCVLQLVPYHSPYFGLDNLVRQLRSTSLVRQYVQDLARRPEIQIIVTRA